MPDIIRHEKRFRPRGYGYREFQAPVIKCACGEEVVCERFTNACECGRDYGRSGDLLASRSQWGEETGEHIADILRIP